MFPARVDSTESGLMIRVVPMAGAVMIKANEAKNGAPVVRIALTAEEARHLADLLTEAANESE